MGEHGTPSGVGPALNDLAAALVAGLEAEACAISWLVGDLILDVAQHSRSGKRLLLGYGYLVSDYPLTREVVERAVPRAVSLLEDDPDPNEARVLREMGFVSLLMLPLVAGGACRALVEVYALGDRRFDDADAEEGLRLVSAAAADLAAFQRADAVA